MDPGGTSRRTPVDTGSPEPAKRVEDGVVEVTAQRDVRGKVTSAARCLLAAMRSKDAYQGRVQRVGPGRASPNAARLLGGTGIRLPARGATPAARKLMMNKEIIHDG